ncbi:MFS transporter, DHA1 family, inner membrane transport protein [Acidiphilium rubrum]|jgi:DHA1 family inner membrane transport protein|uniref:MFS transporter, DHA1 family, inner membrane transport protein n=1 Tax=Acidiphilium rubrum TaxID=526 RepID=A0A8G2CL64_ACIRU|nr:MULTISPECIES: MFS transporter [Acidiphilium]SIQ94370.1 MFS transporter, DHA1 family, inner membrane transport protein [Acidiphilium rubrum]
MPLPLIALIVASFAIGTSEFVIVGLVPELARDFAVSVPQAGYLVTAYALGVTFGSPFVAVLVGRWQRRTALISLMGVFVLGNALCALAPGYWTMMAARVITALSHGAFFGIGSVVAADLVPREKRARAVALVFLGLTMANVLGVPAGTILGQAAGWRATFWAVMAIGLLSMAAIAVLLPKGMPGGSGRLLNEVRILGRTQVLLAMLMAVLSSMSLFSVFTYIAPLLEKVSGLSPHWVSVALLIFGAGLTAGGLLGGRLADRHSARTIVLTFSALAVILVVLRLVSFSGVLAIGVLLVWGIAVFTMVSPLQTRVIDYARDAPNLASTINQGAFNLGNAAGAWVGGAALGVGVSYLDLPLVGALMAVLGLGVALWTFRLEQRTA